MSCMFHLPACFPPNGILVDGSSHCCLTMLIRLSLYSASQTERIELIKVALRNKIGEGSMKHYGILETQSGPPPERSPNGSSTGQLQGNGESDPVIPGGSDGEHDDGMYL